MASIIARAGGVMGVRGWPLEKRVELTRKAAQGRIPRGGVALGAERRLRSRGGQLPRGARRQRVGHHRQQVLVHVRRRRRLHSVARARRGAGRRGALHGTAHASSSKSRAANCRRAAPVRADSEDRLLRLEDVRTRVRRLPHSEGQHHHRRRFGRFQEHRVVSRTPRAPTPPRVRSGSRAARWKTRWRTRTNACSSACRSPTFRRRASRSRGWRARSKPRAS